MVTAIVIGCGARGNVYATYALENPNELTIVGCAEPDALKRRQFQTRHGLPPDMTFESWDPIAQKPKCADAVIICTRDADHCFPAIAFAKLGYHILLEKPMAISETDCREIVAAVKENNVMLCVCHVMRYTPYTQAIKSVVDSGILGQLCNVQHTEPVGFMHYAHSYVNGNWRRSDEATSILMSKSCHDIDWLMYVLGGRCEAVTSMGSLVHFTENQQPKAAAGATRCTQCPIEKDCPYSAVGRYMGPLRKGWRGWPGVVVNPAIADASDIEEAGALLMESLEKGPYGRCVYHSDNDVMDNQHVLMRFEGGLLVNMSMIAQTVRQCTRQTVFYGSMGQLDCDELAQTIVLKRFVSNGSWVEEQVPIVNNAPKTALSGHSGADYALMSAFVAALNSGGASKILSDADATLASHLLVFEIEKARIASTINNL
mgnify:CR=1 FL=1